MCISAFLVSELEAARMILVNKPQKKAQDSGSPAFQELKGICMTLGMSKPPANITMFQFFSGIEKKVCTHKKNQTASWQTKPVFQAGQSLSKVPNPIHLLNCRFSCDFLSKIHLPIVHFSQLKEAMSRVQPNHVGEPLMKKPLGPVHLVNTKKLQRITTYQENTT